MKSVEKFTWFSAYYIFFNVACIGKNHSKSVFGKDRNLQDEVLEHYDGLPSPL